MSDERDPGAGAPETATAGAPGGLHPEVEVPTGAAAFFGPFFNAILAPAQTFRALDAKPALAWWIVAWIAVLSTILSVINLPITQRVMVAVTRAQLQASGRELSAEELQQAAQGMATFGTIAAYASSVFVVLMIAVTALVLWVLASIMGGKGATFGRTFGVAAAAAVIRPFLYSVYVTIILNMNPPEIRRPQDAATMTPTLGLDLVLAGPDTPVWLEVIYQRIDLFNLWWMALIVMGSMAVLKLSKGQGIAAAVVIWLLGTLIAVGGALLQGLAA